MLASLPMYDWPEIRGATDAFWQALAEALRAEGFSDVPEALSRAGEPADAWGDPDLLISQTCGYPLTHEWRGRLRVLATPHYAAQGCSGPDYRSFIVVRRDEGFDDLAALRGKRAVYNGTDSQSGYSAFRAAIAPLARNGRFFGDVQPSGMHLHSMRLVASGAADVCAVDSVVWALARQHHGDLTESLSIVAATPVAPALPYVTSPGRSDEDVARLRAALVKVLTGDTAAPFRDALLLNGVSVTEAGDYDRILQMERDSLAMGYAVLQ